jgi:concanavalin A-like lectin/glucanase superfamily protein
MRKLSQLLILAVLFGGTAQAAYNYRRSLTINCSNVTHNCGSSSDQSNFPVLVVDQGLTFWQSSGGKILHTTTVSVGGGARSITIPADLNFFSNSDCSTGPLSWEPEDYSTGVPNFAAWVKIPTLSHTGTTTIYVCYNDASVTTFQGNVTGTWDSSFKYVGHLANGTTAYGYDSTNQNNGTNSGSPTASTGKVGNGAITFASASSQHIDLGTASSLNPAAITVSAWVKTTTAAPGGDRNAYYCRGGANQAFYINSNGNLQPFFSVTGSGSFMQISGGAGGSHTLSLNTWYHVAVGYDSSVGLVAYVNGASDGTNTAAGTLDTTANASNNSWIGGDNLNGRYHDGSIDEVRVSNLVRSADWITTEYNSMNAPSTFITIGSEVFIGPNGAPMLPLTGVGDELASSLVTAPLPLCSSMASVHPWTKCQ